MIDIDLLNMYQNLQNLANLMDKKETEEGFWETITKYPFLPPSIYLSSSYSTFLAPAHHLNVYSSILRQLNERVYSNNDTSININDPEIKLFQKLLGTQVQTIIISVKSLLDRLSKIFTYFYPGLNPKHCTFSKPEAKRNKGLMAKVMESKDTDEIMMYVYTEYEFWIKDAVKARDEIIHYNDLEARISHVNGQRVLVYHSDISNLDEQGFPNEYVYKDLERIVENLYIFFEKSITMLTTKQIKLQRGHFDKAELYTEYKNNLNS